VCIGEAAVSLFIRAIIREARKKCRVSPNTSDARLRTPAAEKSRRRLHEGFPAYAKRRVKDEPRVNRWSSNAARWPGPENAGTRSRVRDSLPTAILREGRQLPFRALPGADRRACTHLEVNQGAEAPCFLPQPPCPPVDSNWRAGAQPVDLSSDPSFEAVSVTSNSSVHFAPLVSSTSARSLPPAPGLKKKRMLGS
jgi:hypothetical protein